MKRHVAGNNIPRGYPSAKSTAFVLMALLTVACAPKFNKSKGAAANPVSSEECDAVMSPKTSGGALFCPASAAMGSGTDTNNVAIAGYGDNIIHVACEPSGSATSLGTNICASAVVATNNGGLPVYQKNIYTLAGQGYPVNSGDGQLASGNVGFYKPTSTAVDSVGNVLVAIPTYHSVRVICLASGGVCSGMTSNFITPGVGAITVGTVYTLAGSQIANTSATSTNTGYGFDGDAARAAAGAKLNYPVSIAVDSFDNVLIADKNNARVRVVCTTKGSGVCSTFGGDPADGYIHTLAGQGASSCVGCLATTTSLKTPVGVSVDSNNNIAIADAGNANVRVICTSTAGLCNGNATAGTLSAGGAPITTGDIYAVSGSYSSMLAGVGFDSFGNLFASDPGNSRVSVVCSNSLAGVCGNVANGKVQPNGTAGGVGVAYTTAYPLSDNGSGADIWSNASINGEMGPPSENIGFNYATHAIGITLTSQVIVSDRNNNIVRVMAY